MEIIMVLISLTVRHLKIKRREDTYGMVEEEDVRSQQERIGFFSKF